MSYFDNANTHVTRKSFGSKVDKSFPEKGVEGVIPVKDRKKANVDYVAESAKMKELNKKVEDRRMSELTDKKAFEKGMQEGFVNLKESLMKDILTQICVESLLVDKEDVDNNLKTINHIVEEHVDNVGGFNGIKKIAESTNNKLLQSFVLICEETSKKVGERNMKDAKGDAKKLDFELSKEEMDDFDYKKQSVGVETVVDVVKDKVLNVVQDEQKMNANKKDVMMEIEDQINSNEEEIPAEEAMQFIFNQAGIEEVTLFDSLMRRNYKQFLESNSSYIFESIDFEDEMGDFEDDEFSIQDLIDDDDFDEDEYDDEDFDDYEEGFVEEALAVRKKFKKRVVKLERQLAKLRKRLSRAKDQSAKDKIQARIQAVTSELQDLRRKISKGASGVAKKAKKVVGKESMQIIEGYFTMDNEEFTNTLEAMVKELEATVEGCKSKKNIRNCKEAIDDLQETTEEIKDKDIEDPAEEVKEEQNYFEEKSKKLLDGVMCRGKKDCEEEVIVCPDCGEVDCVCGEGCNDKALENFSIKLYDLTEKLNNKLDAYEIAYNEAAQSMVYEINNESTVIPYLQPTDCNLNNLVFTHKAKMVCESLKEGLKTSESNVELEIVSKLAKANLDSINSILEALQNNENFKAKVGILENCKQYISKVAVVADEYILPDPVEESFGVFSSVDAVDKVLEQVKDIAIIENTNNDVMELVMAEAIVEYTIIEAFNTLRITNQSKDDVRRMSRHNLNK